MEKWVVRNIIDWLQGSKMVLWPHCVSLLGFPSDNSPAAMPKPVFTCPTPIGRPGGTTESPREMGRGW